MNQAAKMFSGILKRIIPQNQGQDEIPFGFQVLRNPNPELPIEPWFDFIIGINHRRIVRCPHFIPTSLIVLFELSTNTTKEYPDPALFSQEIRNCAGGHITLSLWSAKGQTQRQLTLPIPHDNPGLGLTLQSTNFSVTDNTWRVEDVQTNSPAAQASLLPYSDYIIGTPVGTLHGEKAIVELINEHLNRPLTLWVYNSEYNVVRELTVIPSHSWGGEGALGCGLSYGLLHRIPAPLSEPLAGPGEVMFEGAHSQKPSYQESSADDEKAGLHFEPLNTSLGVAPPPSFIVPAESGNLRLGTPEPLHAQPLGHHQPHAHGRRTHKVVRGKGLGIDDYFNEGEQKSRELDYVPSKSPANLPPPPMRSGSTGPAIGGPPRAGPPMGGPLRGPPRSGSAGPPKVGSPAPVATESPFVEDNKLGVVRPETMESEKSID